MTLSYGTFYGIGVGPGDPELMTLRAVRILSGVDRVYAASSTKNDASVALSIARPHLKEEMEVHDLGFPMTRDKAALAESWEANATEVEEFLRSGRNAAFLTLGDPLVYSTFGYLASTLREKWPTVPIEVVPGITSFQAAASRMATILTESGQSLQIISGVCGESELRRQMECAENIVILKAYRNIEVIRKVLDDLGLMARSMLASRIGQPGETILPLAQVQGKPHYFSLILVTSKERGRGW